MHGKAAAFKNDFVLPAHQMGVNQGQPTVLGALQHGGLALCAFATVVGRCVDDHQQLGPQGLAVLGGASMPSVFANEQAHTQRRALGLGYVKHTGLLPGHEVALFVKHLVVGQLALMVGVKHLPCTHHAGRIEARRPRHAARRLQHVAVVCLRKSGVTHNQGQVFECCGLLHDAL